MVYDFYSMFKEFYEDGVHVFIKIAIGDFVDLFLFYT